ncbi:hypothetical protein BC826DRAFT_382773 [Russula brevipes]|nr:hypothetical protein BC826DRAFT_382773 [Russula brevipes]
MKREVTCWRGGDMEGSCVNQPLFQVHARRAKRNARGSSPLSQRPWLLRSNDDLVFVLVSAQSDPHVVPRGEASRDSRGSPYSNRPPPMLRRRDKFPRNGTKYTISPSTNSIHPFRRWRRLYATPPDTHLVQTTSNHTMSAHGWGEGGERMCSIMRTTQLLRRFHIAQRPKTGHYGRLLGP